MKNQHKKILYVPGMISLSFIPLFCLLYFYSQNSFVKYGSIDIAFLDDKSFQEVKAKYGFPIPRKYEEFVFNSQEKVQIDKFKTLKLSLQKLKKDNDTIKGVKIHLGKHCDYASYIRLLNILSETDMPTWIHYQNDIWVLIGNRSKKQKSQNYERMNCGTQDIINRENAILLEIEEKSKKQEFLNAFYKSKWMIFVGYIGIVILNIFSLIKLIKKKKHNVKHLCQSFKL